MSGLHDVDLTARDLAGGGAKLPPEPHANSIHLTPSHAQT